MCCLVWKLFLTFINVFAWNVNCLLFIHVLSGEEIVSVFINVIAWSGNRFVFLLILLRFSSCNLSLPMKFGNSEDGNSENGNSEDGNSEDDESSSDEVYRRLNWTRADDEYGVACMLMRPCFEAWKAAVQVV